MKMFRKAPAAPWVLSFSFSFYLSPEEFFFLALFLWLFGWLEALRSFVVHQPLFFPHFADVIQTDGDLIIDATEP